MAQNEVFELMVLVTFRRGGKIVSQEFRKIGTLASHGTLPNVNAAVMEILSAEGSKQEGTTAEITGFQVISHTDKDGCIHRC
jgi:hypothetical protein